MKKRTSLAVVCVALLGFSTVSAEMVNIGMGQMEQSEFMALKAMVQGQPVHGEAQVSTPLKQPVRYGWVDMSPEDFQALRDSVDGRTNGRGATSEATPAVKMVNIGTGEMPEDEFVALKRMVRKSGRIVFDGLATLVP
jgi:hypothetical protein